MGRPLLDEALNLSLAARSTPFVTLSLTAYARLTFAEDDSERAAMLEGAAQGLRQRVGLRAWPMLRRGEAELVAQVRQTLGADRFVQAFDAGVGALPGPRARRVSSAGRRCGCGGDLRTRTPRDSRSGGPDRPGGAVLLWLCCDGDAVKVLRMVTPVGSSLRSRSASR